MALSYNARFFRAKLAGGGFNPKKPKPKMGIAGSFWVFWVLKKKGVESTFLNIPDHLRPTCFLHFFREISLGSDTLNIFNIRNFNFTNSQKNYVQSKKLAKKIFKRA